MALIFYLSAQPDPMPAVTTRVWDKLLHSVEYAALAALLGRALLGEGLSTRMTFGGALLLAAAYGASDEYHQMFVPFRTAELDDWIVDVVGGCIGAAVYLSTPGAKKEVVGRIGQE
jgi:VanZ family protein